MFFIFNQMAEVAQEDKLTGDNPFGYVLNLGSVGAVGPTAMRYELKVWHLCQLFLMCGILRILFSKGCNLRKIPKNSSNCQYI
jgi:hypothetical protein